MANALVKSGLPYNIAFVVSAGMQFVTVLGRKAREVLEAQQTRGIPISAGWRVIRRFPTFFIPLLIQSFQLAEELAEGHGSSRLRPVGTQFLYTIPARPQRLDCTDLQPPDHGVVDMEGKNVDPIAAGHLNIADCLKRHTIIIGAVNSGKTRLTREVMDDLTATGPWPPNHFTRPCA